MRVGEPDWMAVGAQQVLDCSRLATDDCHRLRAPGGSGGDYEAGVASAIAWALGASPSLVSNHGGPVDRATAEAEFFATVKLSLDGHLVARPSRPMRRKG